MKAVNYWMVKQEPEDYSWSDLVRDKSTDWTGVRNYQARNSLREMKVGDKVLVYHSVTDKHVVGIAEVTKAAFQDPTTDDDKWVAVELKAVKSLKRPVSLATIKSNAKLSGIGLIRQSQLSVITLTADEYQTIVELAS